MCLCMQRGYVLGVAVYANLFRSTDLSWLKLTPFPAVINLGSAAEKCLRETPCLGIQDLPSTRRPHLIYSSTPSACKSYLFGVLILPLSSPDPQCNHSSLPSPISPLLSARPTPPSP